MVEPASLGKVERRFRTVDVLAIVFFLISTLPWLYFGEFIIVCVVWAFKLNKGDTGYHIFLVVPIAVVGGLVCTAIALPLAFLAKRLPMWFRVLSMFPAGGAFLFAATQVLALFMAWFNCGFNCG